MNSDNQRAWMLVDDDDAIRQLLPQMLHTFTDAPIECFSQPQAALAAFRGAPERYELVITDFEMPGMNGAELCRKMHMISPAKKIFLMTGGELFTWSSARLAGFAALLAKPFQLSTLNATLAGMYVNETDEPFHQTCPKPSRC